MEMWRGANVMCMCCVAIVRFVCPFINACPLTHSSLYIIFHLAWQYTFHQNVLYPTLGIIHTHMHTFAVFFLYIIYKHYPYSIRKLNFFFLFRMCPSLVHFRLPNVHPPHKIRIATSRKRSHRESHFL